jgi:hypothetical protein
MLILRGTPRSEAQGLRARAGALIILVAPAFLFL